METAFYGAQVAEGHCANLHENDAADVYDAQPRRLVPVDRGRAGMWGECPDFGALWSVRTA